MSLLQINPNSLRNEVEQLSFSDLKFLFSKFWEFDKKNHLAVSFLKVFRLRDGKGMLNMIDMVCEGKSMLRFKNKYSHKLRVFSPGTTKAQFVNDFIFI